MVNLDNLFKRIAEQGLNAKKVSESTGISTGNISDWKNGRSMPSAVKLDILADYLDCSVDYLLGRTDEPQVFVKALYSDICQQQISENVGNVVIQHFADSSGKQKSTPPLSDEAQNIAMQYTNTVPAKMAALPKSKKRRDGFTEIRVYDQPAAAGLGNYLDEPDYHIEQFPPGWIPPQADFGIKISGDSMEPDIQDGSTVFVQASIAIDSNKIGIFILNGQAYCKKLFVDKDKQEIRLVSLNRKYDDILIRESDDFRTVGQVLL